MVDNTGRLKEIQASVDQRPDMPAKLALSLGVTAANAQVLLDHAKDGRVYLVDAAMLLYDAADALIKDWDENPDHWRSEFPNG